MELVTTYICKKFDIGIHDNMFGGTLMSLIDDAAGSYGSQICDTPHMLTIKVDGLVFKKPVKVGNIIKLYAKVVNFGNSSIELYIEVRKHHVHNGAQETVTHTHVKLVSVNDEGRPKLIPEQIKQRYKQRYDKFGKGLLSAEEKEMM